MRRSGLVVAVAIALVACMLAGPGTAAAQDAPPIDLQTLESVDARMAESGSVRFAGRITVTSNTREAYLFEITGSSDLARERAAWSVSSTVGQFPESELVSIGDTLYVSVRSLPKPRPPAVRGKRWIEFSGAADLSLTGPRRNSTYADLPGLEFRVVGSSRLDGVDTTRVHLQWPQEFPEVPLSNGYTLPAETKVQRVDLWIDAEGRLRRELAILYVKEGRETVSIRTVMDYSEYGRRVRVPLPASGETVDSRDLDPSILPAV